MRPPAACTMELMRILAIVVLCVAVPGLWAQAGDWPMYNRDLAGTRYSPLTQINTKNAAKLTKAWTFRLDARASEATPIVVNGVMYLPAGNSVVALEPETGKEIWRYTMA